MATHTSSTPLRYVHTTTGRQVFLNIICDRMALSNAALLACWFLRSQSFVPKDLAPAEVVSLSQHEPRKAHRSDLRSQCLVDGRHSC